MDESDDEDEYKDEYKGVEDFDLPNFFDPDRHDLYRNEDEYKDEYKGVENFDLPNFFDPDRHDLYRNEDTNGPPPELNIHGNDTVTIFINLHGEIDMTPLQLTPTNTVLGTSVGLCQFAVKPDTLLTIDTLKQIYESHRIHEANEIYSSNYAAVVLPQSSFDETNEVFEASKADLMAVHNEPWDKLKPRYITQSYKLGFKRSYRKDKIYDMSKDDLAPKMGVFIIHTTNPALQLAMQTLHPLKLPPQFETEELDSRYAILQGQNLNNVDVAQSLHPYGMTDTMGVPASSPQNYTGIKHYSRLKLSAILRFFSKFGINHVNIVDESCRVFKHHPPPIQLQRQISEEELRNGELMLQRLRATPKDGGTKRNIRKSKNKRLKATPKDGTKRNIRKSKNKRLKATPKDGTKRNIRKSKNKRY